MIICQDGDGRVALRDSVTRRSVQYFEPCSVRRDTGDPPPYADDRGKIIVRPFVYAHPSVGLKRE